jgi:hypothetical protein
MAADIVSKGSPDGTTLAKTSTELLSFWCGTPSAQFTITCLGATCVVATMVSRWNTFVAQARTRGFCT